MNVVYCAFQSGKLPGRQRSTRLCKFLFGNGERIQAYTVKALCVRADSGITVAPHCLDHFPRNSRYLGP